MTVGKVAWNVDMVLVLVILGQATAAGVLVDVPVLLAKGKVSNLRAKECQQLATALRDRSQVSRWVEIGEVIHAHGRWLTPPDVAADMVQYWSDRPDELGRLSILEIRALVDTCWRLGGTEHVDRIVPMWMKANGKWKQLAMLDLAEMASMVRPPRQDLAWAQAVARDHIWGTYLSGAIASGGPKRMAYLRLAEAVASNLTESQKQHVAQQLGMSFRIDQKTLRSISVDDATRLASALTKLKGPDSGSRALAFWMTANTNWKQANAMQLYAMCVQLQPGTSTGVAAQKSALALHILANYLDPTGDPFPSSLFDLARLVEKAAPLFSAAQKGQAARGLVERLAGAPQGVACEVMHIWRALRPLYRMESDLVPELVARWMAASDKWQVVGVSALAMLAGALGPGDSAIVAKQKSVLVGFLMESYFGPKADLSRVSVGGLASLAHKAQSILNDEQNSIAAMRVVELVRDPKAASQMQLRDLQAVELLLNQFDRLKEELMPEAVAHWMAASDKWRDVEVREVTLLTKALSRGGSAIVAKQKSALAGFLMESYLGPKADLSEVSVGALASLAYKVRSILNDGQNTIAAMRVTELLRSHKAISQMQASDFLIVKVLLGQEQLADIIAQQMSDGHWKKDTQCLVALTRLLRGGTSPLVLVQREAVVKFILSRPLRGPADVVAPGMLQVIGAVYPWMSNQQKDKVKATVEGVFRAPTLASQVTMQDLRGLPRFLAPEFFTTKWLVPRMRFLEEWGELQQGDLRWL